MHCITCISDVECAPRATFRTENACVVKFHMHHEHRLAWCNLTSPLHAPSARKPGIEYMIEACDDCSTYQLLGKICDASTSRVRVEPRAGVCAIHFHGRSDSTDTTLVPPRSHHQDKLLMGFWRTQVIS
jgi:hypothetical protein